mmetsp:Transcript_32538/g.85738  ORF Transcript_32538/g.85738 Transcript_32538/m.85738 type:complete len:343 (+) Transcript_32538:90-1118(+)
MMNLAVWHNIAGGRGKDPKEWNDRPSTPLAENPIRHDFWDPHVIVSSTRPVPVEATVAIHPLGTKPLQHPHGKKILAMELGAWYGSRGYYRHTSDGAGGLVPERAPPARRRKYVAIDGRVFGGLSLCQKDFYHQGQVMRLTIAWLATVARLTDRIIILPRVVLDYHLYFPWTHLDLKTLDEAGVEWRETNFPSNPRSWLNATHPFESVARTALYPNGEMYAQVGDDGRVHKWNMPFESPDTIDAYLAAHTEGSGPPGLSDAELLLVNPWFIKLGYSGSIINRANRKSGLRGAEALLFALLYTFRWCGKTLVLERPAHTAMIHHDCYGQGAIAEELRDYKGRV